MAILRPQSDPSYAGGYARSAGESAYPGDWKGLQGLWVPSLGATGDTLFDVSSNKNHGAITSLVTWESTDKGSVVEGGGDANHGINVDPTLGNSQQFTVVAVFRVNSFSTDRRVCPFSGNDGTGTTDYSLHFNTGPVPNFYTRSGGSDNDATGTTTLAANQWYTMVGTFDRYADAQYVYLDGAQEGSVDPFNGNVSLDQARIAGVSGGAIDSFNGQVLMCGMYNYAMTDGQVATLSADPLRLLRPVLHIPYSAAAAASGDPEASLQGGKLIRGGLTRRRLVG